MVTVTPSSGAAVPARVHRDPTHYLYLAVVAAVVLGAITGLTVPHVAAGLKPLGTAFVNLIKMMISTIIFCTLVLGIGSGAATAKLGRVGLLAIGYFLVMSTFALLIGLIVGNLLHPDTTLKLNPASVAKAHQQAQGADGTVDFLSASCPRPWYPPSPRAKCCPPCWSPCSPDSRYKSSAPPVNRSGAVSSTSSGGCFRSCRWSCGRRRSARSARSPR
jgi:hypothetical protein